MKDLWLKPISDNYHLDHESEITNKLKNHETPYFIAVQNDKPCLVENGYLSTTREEDSLPCIGILPAISPSNCGDKSFQADHGTKVSYMAGGMANGISSVDMVVALGKAGFLGSFGTGGLSLSQIEVEINQVKKRLPNGPYTFNFLNNPFNTGYEEALIGLYLKYEIRSIEAAAFINPSPALVHFKIAGLSREKNGNVISRNKIIVKLSREEVAIKFMSPPSKNIINMLLESAKITREQAELARSMPIADDITAEADSGGHTDNRPFVSLLPQILTIRDHMQKKYAYTKKIRVGAAGGISTPQAALAAFSMGADYIVTGSVNQSCVEAATSEKTKQLLSQVKMADVMMAPAADAFESEGRVQVIKKGTMFPMIANKLLEYYNTYESIEEMPVVEKNKLEKNYLKKDIESIWKETEEFFKERDPKTLWKAEQSAKKKMALIFRWYLGNSSMWAIKGDEKRMFDAQIWCGQSMGAFNEWVKGSRLEKPENRKVAEIADLIMKNVVYLMRMNFLKYIHTPMETEFDGGF